MSLTPEAKKLLAETIRGTAQDPERGLRARLLRAIHDEADRRYRLSVPIEDAGLDEAHRRRRDRIEVWIEERTRAAKPKTIAEEKSTRARLLAQAEKEAGATLVNRMVVLRLLEACGLSKPAVLTGGWTSKGYREFHEFGRTLCANGTSDATEGYGALLQLVFDEMAVDLPGLFGDVGLTRLFPVPAATLRDVVDALDNPELASAWIDDTTLGWVYQFWNDFERDALDEKVLGGGKVEPHEIASKTQMFTDRYIVEWLLQNSLGLTWLCMCAKHGWTPDAEVALAVLESRREDWRVKRDAGEVALDALMPIESELEDRWKYFVPQALPVDAVEHAPDSVRDLKILDPAVGSGHFLVIAFGLLASLYREEARHRDQAISDREIAESIVENNLHGIDIDPRAIQIAAAGLYLKVRSLARDARPRHMNLVAPALQLGTLPKDDPAVANLRADLKRDVGIPEALTNRLLDALAGVDYLGSLLKVDAAIDDAIRTVELSFEEGAESRPLPSLSGSLVTARETLLDKLEAFLTQHSSSEDLGLRLDGEQLAAGVRFVRMARELTYDVVVGNPPYQGLAKTESMGYVAREYPRGKADLCTAFLLRGLSFTKPHGVLAMVVMRAWMFLSQLTDLRKHLLESFDLRGVGDLDKGAFESMPTSQLISVVMTVLRNAPPSMNPQPSFALQPTAPGEKYWGGDRTDLKRAAVLVQRRRFEFHPTRLAAIAGEPVVYWWSEDFLAAYARHPKIAGSMPMKVGVQTSDDVRFMRLWWEVDRARLSVGSFKGEPVPPGGPWRPVIAGAVGRTWIQELHEVINWNLNGGEIAAFARSRFGRGADVYFLPGVAFTTIGDRFGGRAHRYPSIISSTGCSLYPESIAQLTCLLNSGKAKHVLSSLNPTIHFTNGDVERLPLFPTMAADEIFGQVEQAFERREAARETSIEFKFPGPSAWDYTLQWAEVATGETAQEALRPYAAVEEPPSAEAWISYAVGVALGRFHDAPQHARDARATVDAPGILFVSAASGDSLDTPACAALRRAWDEYATHLPEHKDLRTYLQKSFFEYHNSLYEKRPIYFPLSSARRNFVAFASIHQWRPDTLSRLLADHLMPTKRRLEGEQDDLRAARAAGTNKRQAERRFTEVQRLLEELNDFIEKVTAIAERGPPPSDDSTPKREVDVRHEMDLDDGVMVNSAGLWPILESQWKDPKKWWKELATAKGKKDYDWSHLAARYFPTRIRKKCHDDTSLAVAHKCFWQLHSAKAYAWELRLQDEIQPDFTIDEPDSDAVRVKFVTEHKPEAAEIQSNEMKRRARKAAKADDDSDSGPLFKESDDDDEVVESSDD